MARTIQNLEEAARIARGDDRRIGGFDVAEFALQEIAGHFGLDQIINPRAAATPGALGEFDEFEVGNGAEQSPRLRGDFLPVAKVTGLVIGNRLLRR